MKRLLTSILIIMIFCTAFISGLFRFNEIPVYADSVPDGFTQVNSVNEQVQAFQYYCKSRNLAIEGSVLDAVTSVTTKSYQTAVNAVSSEIGFDMNSLQAELYKRPTSSGQEFFYTAAGINAMNRIFAEFLQNNNLEVGDEVNDQVLEQGKFYNGSFVYVFRYNYNLTVDTSIHNEYCTSLGTPYMSTDSFIALWNSNNQVSITTPNGNFTFPMYKVGSGYYTGSSESYAQYTNIGSKYTRPGFPAYFMTTKGELCFGAIFGASGNTSVVNGYMNFMCRGIITGENDNVQETSVYITTNNTTINNNNYEGDTIINHTGVVHHYVPPTPPKPPGGTTPDWGTSGDGGDNVWNTDNDGTLNFPSINLPDLDIDWNLNGLTEKFPFSIPFDLIAFFTVLNADPETPSIQGTIDLRIVQWQIDWDLSQFDDLASLLRNLEFIGFCILLVLATRNIIKG